MNVVLTKKLEEFVKAKVAKGRYLDESEVVREDAEGPRPLLQAG